MESGAGPHIPHPDLQKYRSDTPLLSLLSACTTHWQARILMLVGVIVSVFLLPCVVFCSTDTPKHTDPDPDSPPLPANACRFSESTDPVNRIAEMVNVSTLYSIFVVLLVECWGVLSADAYEWSMYNASTHVMYTPVCVCVAGVVCLCRLSVLSWPSVWCVGELLFGVAFGWFLINYGHKITIWLLYGMHALLGNGQLCFAVKILIEFAFVVTAVAASTSTYDRGYVFASLLCGPHVYGFNTTCVRLGEKNTLLVRITRKQPFLFPYVASLFSLLFKTDPHTPIRITNPTLSWNLKIKIDDDTKTYKTLASGVAVCLGVQHPPNTTTTNICAGKKACAERVGGVTDGKVTGDNRVMPLADTHTNDMVVSDPSGEFGVECAISLPDIQMCDRLQLDATFACKLNGNAFAQQSRCSLPLGGKRSSE
eukprot:GDKI01005721.1.p1 GENE.GDKI01005721.1~~GDKI01005721.1.p1  ORF type:complete len:424 (-),score=94.53 GDKI01005721.1:77-1348(-)